jgi:hypothetical protein
MPPTWDDYRTVIARNGFTKERSEKHETWILRDSEGRILKSTRVSHGRAEIRDRGFFSRLLKQCGKSRKHFEEVLRK